MTSTTLKYKSNFAPVLAKVFRQNIINLIAVPAIAIIISAIAISITFYGESHSSGYGQYTVDITFGAVIILTLMAFVSILFSLITAPKLFNEIYKKQSCDMYFSMPIKRKDYYIPNYIYGALINAAGIIISGAIYCGIMPLMSTKHVLFEIDLSHYLINFAIPVLLSVLAIYSSFIMCAVTAGRKIHYILLALICLFATSPAIGGIFANINSIWGMSINGIIPMSIDPSVSAIYGFINEDNQYLPYIISLIEIVGMFFAGLIIFNKRKAEVAEVTLTGKIIPFVLLAVLDLAVFMHYSGYGVIVSVIAGTILTVLVTMAFSGIFYKKVFTKQTGITAGAVCLACIVFICSVNLPSFSGYVKNVPEASEVESIEISNSNVGIIYSSMVANLINSFDIDTDVYNTFTIKDEKAIADAIAMHQKMVDDKVIEESQKYTTQSLLTMFFSGDLFYDDYVETYDCRIKYHLKSGKTLTRTYSVNANMLVSEYVTLMKNEEILNQLYISNISEDDILFTTIDTWNNTTVDTWDNSQYYDDRYDDYSDDYYDDYDYAIYYDQKFPSEKFDGFIKVYTKEMLQMNDNQFCSVFRELNDYNGLDYYYDEYYDNLGEMYFYYIEKDAPENCKKELKAMSPAAIQNGYDSFMYDDDESIYNYVNYQSIYVYANQKETIKYLEDLGIKFPE